jgi:hypothetical protein
MALIRNTPQVGKIGITDISKPFRTLYVPGGASEVSALSDKADVSWSGVMEQVKPQPMVGIKFASASRIAIHRSG